VADGEKIRKVTSEGVTSTVELKDGQGKSTTFGFLYGVTCNREGTMLATDSDNSRIWVITLSGIAFPFPNLSLKNPRTVVICDTGSLLVADHHRIQRINLSELLTGPTTQSQKALPAPTAQVVVAVTPQPPTQATAQATTQAAAQAAPASAAPAPAAPAQEVKVKAEPLEIDEKQREQEAEWNREWEKLRPDLEMEECTLAEFQLLEPNELNEVLANLTAIKKVKLRALYKARLSNGYRSAADYDRMAAAPNGRARFVFPK